jgi:hypothetical protein
MLLGEASGSSFGNTLKRLARALLLLLHWVLKPVFLEQVWQVAVVARWHQYWVKAH